MLPLVLMIALLFSSTACSNHRGVPTELSASTNYTQLITQWAHIRHPNEPVQFKVKMVRPLQIDQGTTEVLALQVHFYYTMSSESYILFIRQGRVLSWVYAGEPEEEEDEDKSEEIFSAKDQA